MIDTAANPATSSSRLGQASDQARVVGRAKALNCGEASMSERDPRAQQAQEAEQHAHRLELMVRCLSIPLAEDVAAMEAGIAALRAPSPVAWQAIETAPKMRKVMVFYLNALGKRRTVLACYYTAKALEMDDDYTEVGEYDEATGAVFAPEGWYEEHDSESPVMPLQADPIYWMPLPPSPVPAPQREDEQARSDQSVSRRDGWRGLAAWMRAPGTIDREDAIDSCARAVENYADYQFQLDGSGSVPVSEASGSACRSASAEKNTSHRPGEAPHAD